MLPGIMSRVWFRKTFELRVQLPYLPGGLSLHKAPNLTVCFSVFFICKHGILTANIRNERGTSLQILWTLKEYCE